MLKIEKLLQALLLFLTILIANPLMGQKINQYNANNERTGKWIKYYSNKRIRYEGQFKNGKEVGVFKFYSNISSQHPVAIKTFREHTDSVFTKYYTIKGVLQSEGYFIDKQRVGKWIYYFPSKQKMSVEHYKNGLLNGELINYYPNGKVTEKTNYKMGLKDGPSVKFTSDGDVLEEVFYEDDKLNGEAKYYDTKGNLKEKGFYKNGKRVGQWEYYMDGELIQKKKKSTYKKEQNKK